MVSIEMPILNCVDGEVVACDIYDTNGTLFIAKDTVINKYAKRKLTKSGIYTAHVYASQKDNGDQKFREDYKENVLKIKSILNNLSSGKKADLDEIMEASDLIYKGINQDEQVAEYLIDIRENDEYTYGHCLNTAVFSMLIGKWLDFPESEIKNLILSGVLHDLGKIKIDNDILNKKGIITKEEYEAIKKHPTIGYDMLEDFKNIDIEVKRAVLLHHERADCSGYPFNAPPEKVGLFAKAVAVADVYDAMTSDRVYKKGVTPFDAFNMFKTVGVGIFDPTIMDTFLKNISTYYVGMNVNLSNGEVGEIVFIPPKDIVNPIVRVGSDYFDLSKDNDIKITKLL